MLGLVHAGADLEQLPPSLRDVLLARADGLSEPARRVLRVAAVGGGRVTDGLLAAVTGLAEPELIEALREAVEHHVLVGDHSGYAFRHALVREALYDDMLPTELSRLHAACGAAVDAEPALAGDEASAAAALAHHWYAAHDLPRALRAAVQAGRHATAASAPADALLHFDRALSMWPRVEAPETCAGVDHVALLELAI